MAKVSFILPLDQPLARKRLLGELKRCLSDPAFSELRMMVAYAKSGPLYRIHDLLTEWKKAERTSTLIVGIDQRGTSKEALQLAMELFGNVYVVQEGGITFHPKIYCFSGKSKVEAFLGSNNLTVGGTEKNFESAVHLELSLPGEKSVADDLANHWEELLPPKCPATTRLDEAYLKYLTNERLVLSEVETRKKPGGDDRASLASVYGGKRTGLKIVPESPLPIKFLGIGKVAKGIPAKKASKKTAPSRPAAPPPLPPEPVLPVARGLAIQIKPHHNGEIFLSVTAALQNPNFFKWPFNGQTTPKKPGNPTYPQLDPDPKVNISVIGKNAKRLLTLDGYALNTVYYEKKSEIRVTAAPLVSKVPEYSIMIMEPSSDDSTDYEITIHTPDSPQYAAWLAACNQKMPSGGKEPRKYGWF